MKGICIVPGTFDPVTVGHYDVFRRVSKLFVKSYVTVFENSSKHTMFTAKERFEMLKLACEGLSNVEVGYTNKLVVDYAAEKGAGFIVKGVRNMIDFDYEYQLATINNELNENLDTLFIPSRSEHSYISSTFVREMILYKRDITKYVPPKVCDYINTLRWENE